MRYADDFVILARYQGRCISDWIDATVEDWMGLEINRELSEPGASLEFLGYSFRYEAD